MLDMIQTAADTKVKVYSLPVLRMILWKSVVNANRSTQSDTVIPSSEQTSTANKNLRLVEREYRAVGIAELPYRMWQ